MFRLATWKVKHGMVARFRAFGNSMEPVVPSGSTVTIEPVDVEKVELGDIVVAKVGDSTMLHLVKAIDVDRHLVEISVRARPRVGRRSSVSSGSALASERHRSQARGPRRRARTGRAPN